MDDEVERWILQIDSIIELMKTAFSVFFADSLELLDFEVTGTLCHQHVGQEDLEVGTTVNVHAVIRKHELLTVVTVYVTLRSSSLVFYPRVTQSEIKLVPRHLLVQLQGFKSLEIKLDQ